MISVVKGCEGPGGIAEDAPKVVLSMEKKCLDLQKQNNEYHRFVDGNLILKQGILDKKKGLWSRRRMFLLTEGPKLFYVDPKEKVLKGEIPWSADMKTEMKDFRCSFHRKQHKPKPNLQDILRPHPWPSLLPY